jgi:hypothetical protein
MADETPETLRAEIDHQRRLAQLVTDAGVRAEIEKMIEELERRLRELEARRTAAGYGTRCPGDRLAIGFRNGRMPNALKVNFSSKDVALESLVS